MLVYPTKSVYYALSVEEGGSAGNLLWLAIAKIP
jgi:hypothetical protein